MKRNVLFACTEEHSPDVVVITEHGLRSNEIESFTLPNYSLVSYYSRSVKKSGGVAIFIKSGTNMEYTPLPSIQNLSVELTCEIAACKLTIGVTSFTIVGIYRSPSCSNFQLFNETIQDSLSIIGSNKAFILGDFNINFSNDNDRNVSDLLSEIEPLNYFSLFQETTRPSTTGGTCIDNIITNCKSLVSTKEVIPISFSDHYAISAKFTVKDRIRPLIYRQYARILNENSLYELSYLLSQEGWDDVYSSSDANTAYDTFLATFLHCYNSACPKLLKKISQRKERFNMNEEVQNPI